MFEPNGFGTKLELKCLSRMAFETKWFELEPNWLPLTAEQRLMRRTCERDWARGGRGEGGWLAVTSKHPPTYPYLFS